MKENDLKNKVAAVLEKFNGREYSDDMLGEIWKSLADAGITLRSAHLTEARTFVCHIEAPVEMVNVTVRISKEEAL